MKKAFSHWESWSKRSLLAGLAYPGVYALAISPTNIAPTAFSWRQEIVYVGMTNAKGGLKSRSSNLTTPFKEETVTPVPIVSDISTPITTS